MPKEILINTKGGDGGIYRPDLGANPGDTVVLDAAALGQVTYCYLGTMTGTPENPIKIVNRNGTVRLSGGFDATDSKHLIYDGGGDSNIQIGFEIDSNDNTPSPSGAGITVAGYAEGIEAKRVSVNRKAFGVWCKNEPNCDPALNAHVIKNVNIHHCNFTKIWVEGTYMGSTNVVRNGANVRSLSCNGAPAVIYPPQIGNIRVEDCTFDGTGRAAIQISQASFGKSYVSRNTVKNVGREYSDAQGNGINLGSGSKVRVQGNNIENTYVSGITSFGQEVEILDNTIKNSGRLDGFYTPWAWGIWIDSRHSEPYTQSHHYVLDNKIGARGMGANTTAQTTADGWHDIGFFETYTFGSAGGWKQGNVVRGNLSTITGAAAKMDIDPDINWGTVGNPAGYGGATEDRITSLFALTPMVVVATTSLSFGAAGLTTGNTTVIYEIGNPNKSWRPERSLNGITGFEAGKGYYIVPKTSFTLTNMLYPPIPTGSLLTTTKLKAEIKKLMSKM